MALVNGLRSVALPADAIEVGRIQEAWGIKGWVRVLSHSPQADAILSASRWFLQPPSGRYAQGFDAFSGDVEVDLDDIKPHGDAMVAKLTQVPDRNAAESLKGARIYVSRAQFPVAQDPDEYYWVDLIGLDVINREGVMLGTVQDLLSTGPNAVLCLEHPQDDTTIERMIPFVSAYVDQVDLPGRRITVDWQPDY